MLMDIKSIQLLNNIHNKIVNRSFDEIDILALLILIRENTLVNHDYKKVEWTYGFLREVCNFVAHRNRNKGFVVEETRLTYKHCTDNGIFHTGVECKRTVISGILENIVISELNNVFSKLGLSKIPAECESEVILCIISLLQFAKLESDDGQIHGYLCAEICNDGIYLLSHVSGSGLSAIILEVEDSRYHNLVIRSKTLDKAPFFLKRVDSKLKIILPE